MKVIGPSAFSHCTNLSSVTLPPSLARIDDFAFANCTELKSLTYRGPVFQWGLVKNEENAFSLSEISTVRCTDGTVTC